MIKAPAATTTPAVDAGVHVVVAVVVPSPASIMPTP